VSCSYKVNAVHLTANIAEYVVLKWLTVELLKTVCKVEV